MPLTSDPTAPTSMSLLAAGIAEKILGRLGPNGRLIAFDQDADALANVPSDALHSRAP